MTYRQVDHWVRQGYVVPSVNAAVGRGGRRRFASADVVRVAALGRFGRARLDIALVGPLVAGLDLTDSSDQLLVAHLDPLMVETVAADEFRQVLAGAGACVVYDPEPLVARLAPPLRGVVVAETRLRTVS